MSNSTLDNIPPDQIKPPVRIPSTDKDIIEIDNQKGRKKCKV